MRAEVLRIALVVLITNASPACSEPRSQSSLPPRLLNIDGRSRTREDPGINREASIANGVHEVRIVEEHVGPQWSGQAPPANGASAHKRNIFDHTPLFPSRAVNFGDDRSSHGDIFAEPDATTLTQESEDSTSSQTPLETTGPKPKKSPTTTSTLISTRTLTTTMTSSSTTRSHTTTPSASSSAQSKAASSSSGAKSKTAIAAVTIAIILVGISIIAAALFFYRRRRQRRALANTQELKSEGLMNGAARQGLGGFGGWKGFDASVHSEDLGPIPMSDNPRSDGVSHQYPSQAHHEDRRSGGYFSPQDIGFGIVPSHSPPRYDSSAVPTTSNGLAQQRGRESLAPPTTPTIIMSPPSESTSRRKPPPPNLQLQIPPNQQTAPVQAYRPLSSLYRSVHSPPTGHQELSADPVRSRSSNGIVSRGSRTDDVDVPRSLTPGRPDFG